MQTTIKLPPPQKDLDFPLMKALEARRSKRKWKSDPLSKQQLSNLLWAGCGITRSATGLSTVVLGLVNREQLHEQMELEAHEKVVYTQVVGQAIEE